MIWLSVLFDVAYFAVYPATVIGPLCLSLLRVLAAPLFHVVRVLVRLCLLPLRVLANLEVSFYCLFNCLIDCLLLGLICTNSHAGLVLTC